MLPLGMHKNISQMPYQTGDFTTIGNLYCSGSRLLLSNFYSLPVASSPYTKQSSSCPVIPAFHPCHLAPTPLSFRAEREILTVCT